MQKIATSNLSVVDYLRKHEVSFSRPQYFRYKARLAAEGMESLLDGRSKGNHRKLTPDAEGFLRGVHRTNPRLSLQKMCESLKTTLGIRVDRSTAGRFLKKAGEHIPWPRPEESKRIFTSCGGFEIIGALALHLDWVKHSAEVIVQERDRFYGTVAFTRQRLSRDRKGRNRLGQFSGDYNRREDVRVRRFASVEEKRARKNYSRMALFQASEFILQRKCLGILALPLITLNGTTRSANGPLGNALEHFCGYNYQHDTLDKFLRELKYLGISNQLLRDQVSFWQRHWRKLQDSPPEVPFLCYYVDGNTKPLWSKKRVKQNKVTMLGRVMGCLEQVFVHDGFGRPVYLETYAGKAPVGEHILGMFEKIEDTLEGSGPRLPVRRVIVMDAAGNGVGTLRAFAKQDKYHYITALDDNQWKPRKVRAEGRAKRYYFGEATLRDCLLELEDSREKGYLVVVRAVRIDWDHGKRTVLITSLPKEAVGASQVVKAYFNRWPNEELQFRSMKSFACLNRVAGYGKKKLPDENVRQAQKKLQDLITGLRQSLHVPLKAIADQEQYLATLIEKERRLHCQSRVVAGKRVVDKETRIRLKSVSSEIVRYQRQIKSIESEWGKDLHRLRQHEKEWLRLQGKDDVYRIDVELDQIMTYFRIALVNLSSWFLNECLARRSMSLAKFLHTILLMPAEIELTKDVRRIRLKRNTKDPQSMTKLEPALQRLNNMKVQHLDGRRIEFLLV
ncbi:helix-turn-helix domain-containing protein [candidate division TA06 bacterium]|uniref:Helix-turn-helix domain-containing protein n=1 Tax=candidate division TA06 bacterium TaxID=2250710 RepID=A0A933I8U2_UNCT6|nr:helix-turn-helix domain-containing protein [candidate division TA06 bacterium]